MVNKPVQKDKAVVTLIVNFCHPLSEQLLEHKRATHRNPTFHLSQRTQKTVEIFCQNPDRIKDLLSSTIIFITSLALFVHP